MSFPPQTLMTERRDATTMHLHLHVQTTSLGYLRADGFVWTNEVGDCYNNKKRPDCKDMCCAAQYGRAEWVPLLMSPNTEHDLHLEPQDKCNLHAV